MGDFSPFAIGPGSIPADIATVPDSGATVVLLGIGVLALAGLRHRRASVFSRL